MNCIFCGRGPAFRYALTARLGESWKRVVEPVCARCHGLLTEVGAQERRVKATGETWFLGHGVGLFVAPEQCRVNVKVLRHLHHRPLNIYAIVLLHEVD